MSRMCGLSLRDPIKSTALHHAAKVDDARLAIRQLWKKGSNSVPVDARDGKGNTALHLAAQSGSMAVLKILLSVNADVDITNDDGKRPVDLCRNEEIRHFFEVLTPTRNFNDGGSCMQLEYESRVTSSITATSHLVQRDAIKNMKEQLLNGCADGYTAVLSLDGGGVRGIIIARVWLAAPTYFKRAKDPTRGLYFLDGGITANNPTMEALSDIHEVNVVQKIAGGNPLKTACIVSIGTGRTNSMAISHELDVTRPKDLFSTVPTYRAARNLLNLLLDQVACSDGAVVRRSECWAHTLGVPFFRFTPTLDKNVELDETDDDALVEMLWTTAVHLKTVWRSDIDELVGLLQLLMKKASTPQVS